MFPNNELNNDLKFVQEINTDRTKRVQCLYRVSTEQQVTYKPISLCREWLAVNLSQNTAGK